MKYEEGQTIYVEWKNYCRVRENLEPSPIKVLKIGRQWVHLERGYRVNKNSIYIDGAGYSSPGTIYESIEAWKETLALSEAWRDFSSMVDKFNPPEGMTVEKIKAAMDLLGLKVL